MQSINPATDTVIADFTPHSLEQAKQAVQAADEASRSWRGTHTSKRSETLAAIADQLTARRDELALLMTHEMGKPIAQARGEIEKCAWVCQYYAAEGAAMIEPEILDLDRPHSEVRYEPLGVIFAVMPWNFPYWQVFRFLAPALMAGNGAIIKHAPNVFGCAAAINEVLQQAGLPAGLVDQLRISHGDAATLIADPRIQAVTLTGSTRAGKAVASVAGAHLKKTVLELGGSDAYVILDDADVQAAAQVCAQSRLLNSGQSCIAAKRFIATAKVHDDFLQALEEAMASYQVGAPEDPQTQIGPLARRDLRDELVNQVKYSMQAGAKLHWGALPDQTQPGAYFSPLILTGVRPGMPAFDEELFGPAAAVIQADDEADAIKLANQSIYGLGGAVFTQDVSRGLRIAQTQLAAGACFVNGFVKSDPRLPFGGIRESGYGRELGRFGLREFVNIKTVCVDDLPAS